MNEIINQTNGSIYFKWHTFYNHLKRWLRGIPLWVYLLRFKRVSFGYFNIISECYPKLCGRAFAGDCYKFTYRLAYFWLPCISRFSPRQVNQ